jgi:two-component system CheB/CheR fusion protein
MQTFHYGLNPGGYLFLGPSENVSREIKLFTIIDKKHRILQRHDGVRATLPMVQTASSSRAVEPTRSPVIRGEDRIDQGARRVMDKYAPAYFVIDRLVAGLFIGFSRLARRLYSPLACRAELHRLASGGLQSFRRS